MKETKKTFKASVLIVEDEESISTVIKYNLEKYDYKATVLTDGNMVLAHVVQHKPDLILLDWMLPSVSGLQLCQQIREHVEVGNTPIIMISGKAHEYDTISALGKGADDYIIKPFSPAELISRMKAVLRRIRPAFSDKVLVFEDIKLDLLQCSVTRDGGEVKLSPIEYQLLKVLMEHPNIPQSRDALITKIWGDEEVSNKRVVDVHITRLRQALLRKSLTGENIIKTVRHGGYVMRTDRRVFRGQNLF